jgi:hypothetical protein
MASFKDVIKKPIPITIFPLLILLNCSATDSSKNTLDINLIIIDYPNEKIGHYGYEPSNVSDFRKVKLEYDEIIKSTKLIVAETQKSAANPIRFRVLGFPSQKIDNSPSSPRRLDIMIGDDVFEFHPRPVDAVSISKFLAEHQRGVSWPYGMLKKVSGKVDEGDIVGIAYDHAIIDGGDFVTGVRYWQRDRAKTFKCGAFRNLGIVYLRQIITSCVKVATVP